MNVDNVKRETSRPTAPSEKSQLEEAAAAGAEGHGRHHHGHQDPDQGDGPTPAVQTEDAPGAMGEYSSRYAEEWGGI